MDNFINLTVSTDNAAYNNTLQTNPQAAIQYSNQHIFSQPRIYSNVEASREGIESDRNNSICLSDFSQEWLGQYIQNVGFDLTSVVYNMINDIIIEDSEQIHNYILNLNSGQGLDIDGTSSVNQVNISINNKALENGIIKTFNFGLSINKETVSANVSGLYVNKRYAGAGSKLLNVIKKAIKTITSFDSQKNKGGSIELYSVETAVMFYIKNGFIIKDIYNLKDPLQKANTVFRIMEFAIREDNIDLIKKFAAMDVSKPEQFQEFIDYVFENTKYGKFFTTYSEAAGGNGDTEASIMRSKFISALFPTNMIWTYKTPKKSKLMEVNYPYLKVWA